LAAINHGLIGVIVMLNHLCKYIVKTIEVLSMLGIILIMIFTAYEVSIREIFGKPTIWTNEITSYMLVWFGMLSILYAYTKKAHVSVDLVYRKFNAGLQKILDLINEILTFIFAIFVLIYGFKYWWLFIFAIFVLIYGFKYWWLGYSRGWRHFGMLDVPMSYTRIAMPIIGFLLALFVLLSIYEKIRKVSFESNS